MENELPHQPQFCGRFGGLVLYLSNMLSLHYCYPSSVLLVVDITTESHIEVLCPWQSQKKSMGGGTPVMAASVITLFWFFHRQISARTSLRFRFWDMEKNYRISHSSVAGSAVWFRI